MLHWDNLIILSSAYNDCRHAECKTLPKGAASGTPAAASSVAVLANLRRDLLPLSETLLSFDTCSLLKETKTLWIFNLLRPFITYPALLVLKFHIFFCQSEKKKTKKRKYRRKCSSWIYFHPTLWPSPKTSRPMGTASKSSIVISEMTWNVSPRWEGSLGGLGFSQKKPGVKVKWEAFFSFLDWRN